MAYGFQTSSTRWMLACRIAGTARTTNRRKVCSVYSTRSPAAWALAMSLVFGWNTATGAELRPDRSRNWLCPVLTAQRRYANVRRNASAQACASPSVISPDVWLTTDAPPGVTCPTDAGGASVAPSACHWARDAVPACGPVAVGRGLVAAELAGTLAHATVDASAKATTHVVSTPVRHTIGNHATNAMHCAQRLRTACG